MKAIVKKRPVLSISMIVKNESKTLRRCLDSLKPILQQLDCQLIITDTGSTDDTVAIATEYATIVNHFDWCEDYSAARNFGLALASGEWYAFIDADEWYSAELSANIIEFFKSKAYKAYGSCAMLMRNYKDKDLYDFTDFYVVRYHRLTPATAFVNKIHENIIYVGPTHPLKGLCGHDGYAFDTVKDAFASKYDKYNMAIEKQLATDSDNLNLLVSYMSSVQDTDREEEVVLKALELAKEKHILSTCNTVYYHVIFHFVNCKKYKAALAYAKEYISEMAKYKYEIYLDGNYAIALAAAFAKEYEMAVEYADKYLQGYDDHMLSPYAYNALTVITVSKTTKESFLLDIVNKLSDYDILLALKYYKQYSFENGKYYTQLFDVMLINYTNSHEIAALYALLDSITGLKDDERRGILQQKTAAYLLTHIDDEVLFTQLNNYPQNIFTTAFCRLNLAIAADMVPQAPADIAKMCANACIAPYLAELLCSGQDPSALLCQLTREQITDAAQMLTYLGTWLCRICLKSLHLAQNATLLKPLMFYIAILDASLKCQDDSQDDSKQLITTTVIGCIARFAKSYYSHELINSNIELLPSAHRFALQAENAINALSADEYISFLRNAIDNSPDMQPLAKTLLAVFEHKLQAGELKPKTEFELLADNVKQNARAFIAQQRLADAAAVLSQLKALVPNDSEIDDLLLMCK